jgi:hypothetical protein
MAFIIKKDPSDHEKIGRPRWAINNFPTEILGSFPGNFRLN